MAAEMKITPYFAQADATRLPLADKSVDLVLGSPPYLDARTYGIGAQRKCAAWVDWMLAVTTEAVRVSRGLVIWVCAGVTRDWCYQPGPEGLLYEWWKRGGRCWRPVYWHRVGIPGSGGKQWMRGDVEYALAFTGCAGPIPFANNTACGHKPKWGPGGEMSSRLADGRRVNQWGHSADSVMAGARDAKGKRNTKNRPSHVIYAGEVDVSVVTDFYAAGATMRVTRGTGPTGEQLPNRETPFPVLANPGNLLKTNVGGGKMGHPMAHENEAPYPEAVPEFFIKSLAPVGGTVLDCFSGSGTTACVASRLGRRGIGFDLRMSQCQLGRERFNAPVAAKKPKRAKVPVIGLDERLLFNLAPVA